MKMKDHYLDGAAKTGDPVQSFEAGEDAVKTGLTAKHFRMIMEVINEQPDREFANMDIAYMASLSQNQVTRRMSELERRGLIERGENRKCVYLGRNVGTWKKKC